jgi:hypothetical protein
MAKTQSVEPIDITPEDSVVPVYLVPLTPEEEAEREAMAAQAEADRIAAEEAEVAKAAAKESAVAKLAALGLTEEEAAAIVGL